MAASTAAMPLDGDHGEKNENNHHATSDEPSHSDHPGTNGVASHPEAVSGASSLPTPATEPVSVSLKSMLNPATPLADSAQPTDSLPGDPTHLAARQDLAHNTTSPLPPPSPETSAPRTIQDQAAIEPLATPIEELAPSSLPQAPQSAVREESTPLLDQAAPVTSASAPLETPQDSIAASGIADAPAVQPQQEVMDIDAPVNAIAETPIVDTPAVETPVVSTPLVETMVDVPAITKTEDREDSMMVDAPPVEESAPAVNLKLAREREDDEFDDAPDAKRAKTESETGVASGAEVTSAGPISLAQTFSEPLATPPVQTPSAAADPTAAMPPPSAAAPTPVAPPTLEELNATLADEDFGTDVTEIQQKKLVEGMRNLKKNKSASAFLHPVDPVALNIPTYLELIKSPMDLGTMERKLKEKEYATVRDYITDFNQMILNCYRFNGVNHAVSAQAGNLKAQFDKQMRSAIPKAGESAAEVLAKKPRRDSIPVTTREAPRRVAAAPRPTATSPTSTETFAMRDGVPIPRRQSSGMLDRPKREIHKPPSKDLPYSFKPRKKSQMADLKFAEHLVEEMRSSKHSEYSWPFLQPVDPVSMNLPTYYDIVKKPMDVSTVSDKLRRNEYDNSEQVRTDFKLMFKNCYDFNGVNNPVTGMAKKYEGLFEALWKQKKAWLTEHAGGSGAQSPASDEEESESEEEEEDDEDALRQQQLAAISQQIADLSKQAQAIVSGAVKTDKKKGSKNAGSGSAKKSKKAAKDGKPTKNRKSGGSSSINPAYPILKPKEKAKPKPKPKKKKSLTERQKEELAEKVGQLGAEQMTEAARMIKEGFRKAGLHELANQPDDNLEFEINIIPDETLVELLMYARRMVPGVGGVARDSDDEYASPVATKTSGKKGKRKPMAKAEQAAQINALRGQIQQFEAGSGSDGMSPDGNVMQSREQDTSDDEDVSGSESEEE